MNTGRFGQRENDFAYHRGGVKLLVIRGVPVYFLKPATPERREDLLTWLRVNSQPTQRMRSRRSILKQFAERRIPALAG